MSASTSNADIVELVNRGEAPFAEPDLSIAISGAVAMGRLTAVTEVPVADAYIIAVPTSFGVGHRPDMSSVLAATEAIADVLHGGEIIVLESTRPPGTTRRISELIAERRTDLNLPHVPDVPPDIHLAHCPERVRPGRIMIEIATNDRVIGGLTSSSAMRAAEMYRTFCHGELIITDAESAEMAKLAENAFRDVNIAFANELSPICERLGVDVWEIRRMANHHPRVEILRPGPGGGGHCIAVDPWFIVESAPDLAPLIRTARHQRRDAGARRRAGSSRHPASSGSRRSRAWDCPSKLTWGDPRESPAVEIVQHVAAALPDVKILAVEPHAHRLPESLNELGNVLLTSIGHAVQEADVLALLVDHSQFRSIKKTQLAGKVVYDTRGMWE